MVNGTVAVDVTAIFVTLLFGGGGCALAYRVSSLRPLIVQTCNLFAAGVLFAAGIVHLLPDSERIYNPTNEEKFPLMSVIAGISFLLLLVLEVGVDSQVSGRC